MNHQAFRQECPSTPRALVKRLVVIILKCSVVVGLIERSILCLLDGTGESLWLLRTWLALMRWLLLLFEVPLLLACFQVDLKALRAILTTADVTHECFGPADARTFLFFFLISFRMASLHMSLETFG